MSYNPSQHKNYDMTGATIDDRITALEAADKVIQKSIEGIPVLPELPTINSDYKLNVSGSKTKTYAWAELPAIPAFPENDGIYLLKLDNGTYTWSPLPDLPAEAGSYALTATVVGSAVGYSWTALAE